MTTKSKRISSIALVATLAVVAGLALSGAAAADTTALAGDGTDYTTGFNASDSDYATYTLSSSGTDFGTDGTTHVHLNMTVNDEHVSVSNSSIASGDTSYTFNVSQGEMATIPGDAGANTTVTVNAWGENADDNVTTPAQTFDWTVEFHDDYAVIYAGDAATAGNVNGLDVETTNEEGGWFTDASSSMTVEADSVGLGSNASGTTVHVVAANTSEADTDPFAAATESKLLGSYSDGAFISAHALTIEGHNQAVFLNEAPSDELTDGYTYATVHERAGHDTYSVHVDDDYEGESSVDMTARANDGYGFIEGYNVKRGAYGTWAVAP